MIHKTIGAALKYYEVVRFFMILYNFSLDFHRFCNIITTRKWIFVKQENNQFNGGLMKKRNLLLAGIVLTFLSIAQANPNLVDLVKKIKPAVVLIETFDKDNKPLGQGSGFFINDKGHIITNHHVIKGAYRVTVKTSSGKEYPVDGIIAKDLTADIVKLAVNLSDANTAFLNLSVNVPSEGEDIVVIGNPLGLEATVSNGIVSAVRDIPAFGKILQITAPISPGSSGSPVMNSKGEVIGIATLVITKGQNLNFAIPSGKIIELKEISKTPIINTLVADSNQAQSFLGATYDELGRYLEAIEACKQAIRTNPEDAEAHNNLGNAYDELGRYQEAIEAYKQAIKIKPDFAEAHNSLGYDYGKLGRYQEAIEAFKQAIRINPEDAKAHNNLGVIYGELGRCLEAIEAFKQAIRINPDFADAHYNLGNDYSKIGRFQEAIEAYMQAIRINPDFAKAHFGLGLTYLVTGNRGSALEEYKILKDLDAEKAAELFNLIYK